MKTYIQKQNNLHYRQKHQELTPGRVLTYIFGVLNVKHMLHDKWSDQGNVYLSLVFQDAQRQLAF